MDRYEQEGINEEGLWADVLRMLCTGDPKGVVRAEWEFPPCGSELFSILEWACGLDSERFTDYIELLIELGHKGDPINLAMMVLSEVAPERFEYMLRESPFASAFTPEDIAMMALTDKNVGNRETVYSETKEYLRRMTPSCIAAYHDSVAAILSDTGIRDVNAVAENFTFNQDTSGKAALNRLSDSQDCVYRYAIGEAEGSEIADAISTEAFLDLAPDFAKEEFFRGYDGPIGAFTFRKPSPYEVHETIRRILDVDHSLKDAPAVRKLRKCMEERTSYKYGKALRKIDFTIAVDVSTPMGGYAEAERASGMLLASTLQSYSQQSIYGFADEVKLFRYDPGDKLGAVDILRDTFTDALSPRDTIIDHLDLLPKVPRSIVMISKHWNDENFRRRLDSFLDRHHGIEVTLVSYDSSALPRFARPGVRHVIGVDEYTTRCIIGRIAGVMPW